MTTYPKAKKDIQTWLKQDTEAYVTTMFDLYALPTDFPGMQNASLKGIEKSIFIENEFKADIGNTRFLPYIQTHEFEALIFCDTSKVDEVIPDCFISKKLEAIKCLYASPELINDSPQTAPSKRILSLHRSYNKVLYGTRIIKKIGLNNLMNECQHFASWIHSLRNLGL